MVCAPHFVPYDMPDSTFPSVHACARYDHIAKQYTPYPVEVNSLKHYRHADVRNFVRSLSRTEVVYTHYDTAAVELSASPGMSPQDNLRKRVSTIKYFDHLLASDADAEHYDYAMHFSYDIAGNVKTLVRDYPAWKQVHQQFKRVDYDYDVISGKVNLLSYNRGFADQYFQRYGYDDDNRITQVESSSDGYIWMRDAAYQYYQHGPLARMSLGDLRVQGVDYAYTIQGWLKAINGDVLDSLVDMGLDGKGSSNSIHAYDAAALTLDYFKGDYRPIGTTPVTHIAAPTKSLYNGNIPRATTALRPFQDLASNYTYDQLNRIVRTDYSNMSRSDASLTNTADYYSSYAYDMDGNLNKLVRYGNKPGNLMMDSLVYRYTNTATTDNKLQNVNDYAANNYQNDIKQHTNAAISRYLYDATGNVVKDQVTGQDTIVWNHYNKVTRTENDSVGHGLAFAYDGAGNRYLKRVLKEEQDTTIEKSDYYVRDAQGNILSIYQSEARYEMNKREWVEYVTATLKAHVGITLPVLLQQVIMPYLEHDGHFRSDILKTLLLHDSYVAGLLGSYPVSFYIRNSAAVKSNMLAHTGEHGDFYSQLATYSATNNLPVLAMALDRAVATSHISFGEMMEAAYNNMDQPTHQEIINLLCNTDSLRQHIMQTLEVPESSVCLDDMAALEYEAGKDPAQFYSKLAQTGESPALQEDFLSFLEGMTLLTSVNSDNNLVGTDGAFTPYFQQALQFHANDSLLGDFLETWSSSFELLVSTNSTQTLAGIILEKEPVDLIVNFIDNEAAGEPAMLYSALAAVPWLTLNNYMGWFQMYNPTIAVTHTVYENVLKNQRIHLSSHHLYGSSRLGTKDYKPGQHYMYWDFAGPTVIADTSSLTTRRPWYSMVYNDAVQGLALSPYGMTDNTKYQVQHLVGQKQYELSNHLGNVQATISDLPVKVGEAHTEYHAPALPAVYDYYPFGMLMPDRYTSDTSSECVTVSQTKWVTTWVTHCYVAAEWVWPGYTSWGSVSVSTSSGLQISAGENSGVQFDVEVLPFEQQDVYLQIEGFYSGSGTFELQEYHNGQWTVLGSASFDKIGEVRITCRPRQAMVRAILRGPYYILAKQLCVTKPVLSQETVLVDICDTDGDKYRFGFNGQEKVNEWAGIGNHLDFGARGYDSRTGRWYSVDPLFNKQPGWSTYKSFYNNPNTYVDPDGKTEYNKIIYTNQEGKTTTYLMVVDKDKLAEKRIDNWVNGSRESKYGFYDIIHTITKLSFCPTGEK
jgi:RHS repeat-associated protein